VCRVVREQAKPVTGVAKTLHRLSSPVDLPTGDMQDPVDV
jgi:hypothetical protein